MRASDFLDAPDTPQAAPQAAMSASAFLDAPDEAQSTQQQPVNPIADVAISTAQGIGDLGGAFLDAINPVSAVKSLAKDATNLHKLATGRGKEVDVSGPDRTASEAVDKAYAPQTLAGKTARQATSGYFLGGGLGALSGAGGAIGGDIGGPVGGLVGALAAPLTAQGIVKGAGAAAKAVDSVASVDQAAAKELASQSIDVNRLSAGKEGAGAEFVRGYLRNTIVGGNIVKGAGARALEQVGKAADETIAKIGQSADAAGAGDKIITGLETAKKAFGTEADRLYGQAENLLPQGFIKLPNLRAVVDTTDDKLSGLKWRSVVRSKDMEALASETLDAIKDASRQGRTNVQTMKAVRSNIGKMLDDAPFNSPEQRFWKRTYGALSKDLEGAAKDGADGAVEAMQTANNFYKHGRREIEKQFQRYGGKKEVEDAFKALSSPDALRNAPQRVTQLFERLPQANRKVVGATLVRRLGQKVDGGEFDPLTFATKWSAIAPKAKAALANGHETAAELDKLVRNIRRVQPMIEAIPATGQVAAGRGSDVAAVLGAFVAPWASAAKFALDGGLGWLLTKPQNARLLNQALETQNPKLLNTAVNAIGKMGIQDKGVREQFDALAKKVEADAPTVTRSPGKPVSLNARPETTTLALAGGPAAGVFYGNVEGGRRNYEADQNAQPKLKQADPIGDLITQQESTPDKFDVKPTTIAPSFRQKVSRAESSGGKFLFSPTSKAVGEYQFIPKTWLSVVAKEKPKWADGLSKGQILKLRLDGEKSAQMFDALTVDNGNRLQKAGVDTSDTALYAAHVLGVGDAIDVLKADPAMPLARFVSRDAIERNRKLMKGKTVGAFLKTLSDKMSG